MLISKSNVVSTNLFLNSIFSFFISQTSLNIHTQHNHHQYPKFVDPNNRKMQTTYSNLMLGHGFSKSLISHWPLLNFIDDLPLTGNNVHHVQKIHQDNACLFSLILLLTYGQMGRKCNKSHKHCKERQINGCFILQLHYLSLLATISLLLLLSNPPSQTLKHTYP